MWRTSCIICALLTASFLLYLVFSYDETLTSWILGFVNVFALPGWVLWAVIVHVYDQVDEDQMMEASSQGGPVCLVPPIVSLIFPLFVYVGILVSRALLQLEPVVSATLCWHAANVAAVSALGVLIVAARVCCSCWSKREELDD
eukprot:TRINITY_DN60545_c0_g1_i1.p1 TRINITY_DN60545_c0_g1~~TRINITY_DN60545_c0_g1_i1.p1  ORF type:complete len:144 (-),score=17.48 TRINITY_DN60545_c0_g1_i1:54-485(-)